MHNPESISVGICTRDRPVMLQSLLESLALLEFPDGKSVRVDIVENGDGSRGERVVEGMKAQIKCPLYFHREPKVGIPFARNHLLHVAVNAGCDAIVFIDDDEIVEPDWLLALCDAAASQPRESVIQGRVISELPVSCDPVIANTFDRKKRVDGEILKSAATNNVLVPLSIVKTYGIYFDVSMANTGGTDTVFFSKASEVGYPILYASNAVVRETVPASRLTWRWLGKRKFRVGLLEGSGRIAGKPASLAKMIFYLLRALISLLGVALFFLLRRKEAALNSWLKACKYSGIAFGRVGYLLAVYDRVDGY